MEQSTVVARPIQARTQLKSFLVAVKSRHVRDVYIQTDFADPMLTHLSDDVSVILGVTGGSTGDDAIRKIALNYEVPGDCLVAFEIA